MKAYYRDCLSASLPQKVMIGFGLNLVLGSLLKIVGRIRFYFVSVLHLFLTLVAVTGNEPNTLLLLQKICNVWNTLLMWNTNVLEK
jgi:hypothetical protein